MTDNSKPNGETEIVVLDAATLGAGADLEPLRDLGKVTVFDQTAPAQLAARIARAHVVVTNKVPLDALSLRRSQRLRLVVVTASLADKIDLEEAMARGIEVKTIHGYATESVAQMTICLMLALSCRLRYYTDYVASGRYSEQSLFAHVGDGFLGLAGRRVGVVGLGAIGLRVAEISTALGASTVYFSTSGSDRSSKVERVGFDELLATSDVITIHAPLTSATENLIDAAALRRMKSHAILVNTGRGGTVNEMDLAHSLLSGQIGGAALDVFRSEPLQSQSPLLAPELADRLILTPHCAWGSDHAQSQIGSIVYGLIDRPSG